MLVQLSRTRARFFARSPAPSILAALRQLDGADSSPKSSSVGANPTEVGPAARAQNGAFNAPSTAAGCGLSAARTAAAGRPLGEPRPSPPSFLPSLPPRDQCGPPNSSKMVVATQLHLAASIDEVAASIDELCRSGLRSHGVKKCGNHPEFIWRPPLTNCADRCRSNQKRAASN